MGWEERKTDHLLRHPGGCLQAGCHRGNKDLASPFFSDEEPSSMCQWWASSRTMKALRTIKIPLRIWDAYQIIWTTLPNFSMDWGGGTREDISTFSSGLWSADAGASAWESGKLESISGLFLDRASLRLMPQNCLSPSACIYTANIGGK